MASSDSEIDKPQCGCPKRAELPDVNLDTGAQSINTERASLIIMMVFNPTDKSRGFWTIRQNLFQERSILLL